VVALRAFVFDGGGGSTAAKAPIRHGPPAKAKAKAKAQPRLWTVRAGDTLATIAAASGVPVARLQQLNPNVEPTSLFIGDKIHLR
jgi:LysM repeat protein